MNNWSDYERYLKPVHLKGQAVTLTIIKAVEEETHPQKGKSVMSPVLYFREVPFGLILSPTNRQTLIALYGDRVADAIGKPIIVQAVSVKVAGNDRQPLRILKQRPAATRVEPATGEIIEMPDGQMIAPPRVEPEPTETPVSELDAHFGTPKITASADIMTQAVPPTSEAEFIGWLKHQGINGKEIHSALGTDAKSWLRMNPGKGWGDVAQTIAATLGK